MSEVENSIVVYGGRDVGYDAWEPILTALTKRTGLHAWFTQVGDFSEATPMQHMRLAGDNYDEVRTSTEGNVFVIGESYGAVLAQYIASIRPLDGIIFAAPVMLPYDAFWRRWQRIDDDREALAQHRRNLQMLNCHAGRTAIQSVKHAAIIRHTDKDAYSTVETARTYHEILSNLCTDVMMLNMPTLPHSVIEFTELQRQRYATVLHDFLIEWLHSADDPVDLVDSGNSGERFQKAIM